jgi:hypothetical protein
MGTARAAMPLTMRMQAGDGSTAMRWKRVSADLPFRISVATVAIALALGGEAANSGLSAVEAKWGHYRDKQLGIEFAFPAHIFSLESAAQGPQGVLFSTADGRARLRVFGFANEGRETPAAHLRRTARTDEADFTYVRTTPRFFVASGTRDSMIFYRRCGFSDRRVSCLQLEYPQREKRAWDDAVTRISRSLRTAPAD